jgi:ethanolamine utilization cobalamin adenosyltransferase
MTTEQQEQEQAREDAQSEQMQDAQSEQMQDAQSEQMQDAQSEQMQDQELFANDELQGFRSRWEEVQAGFVDEPRESVQRADQLVSDLMTRLTSGFDQTRSGLEEQWNKGEEASTEDLRVALTRYRAFFNRLLKI